MEALQVMQEMGHERLLLCSDPTSGLQALIAVHSTVRGPGLGGCRRWTYASFADAATDALRLARGMTYKAAAADIPLGGAKAVIVARPGQAKTEALFRAFGRFVRSLAGDYITAEDVGTDTTDMSWIAQETAWVTGRPPELGGGGDPSPVTALGVLQGMKAAAKLAWGDPSLGGRTVAIQGLGSVGGYLASYLRDEGAVVRACDIDTELAEAARQSCGVQLVSPESVYDEVCDIFAPCALGAVINDRTLPRLRARIVAGGANNQLAEPERHGEELARRGILYAPDFVINAGGLVNVFQEFMGYDRELALGRARKIFDTTLDVFAAAERDRIPPGLAAERLAERRLDAARSRGLRAWDPAVAARSTALRT